jgi:hypothetical protein
VIVIGGTYRESVLVPRIEEDLGGSGFRAARALAGEAELLTAIEPESAGLLLAGEAATKLTVTAVERTAQVAFRYLSPLSTPSITGLTSIIVNPIEADGDSILRFGMIERGSVLTHSKYLVFDPQNPRPGGQMSLEGSSADHLALCANAREIRALAPDQESHAEQAKEVAGKFGAEVVIVKAGASGCFVWHSGDSRWLPPTPTYSVFSLGSGDLFSAAFALNWSRGADPFEAARIASRAAAWWTSTTIATLPTALLNGEEVQELGPTLLSTEPPHRVYLAAPFFSLAERMLVELVRSSLIELGVEVFSPLHDVGVGGDEVALADIEGLKSCSAVFAILDGWDPGTLYEVGFAHRAGVPVVAFCHSIDDEGTKMLVGMGAEIHSDLTSAAYRGAWASRGLPLAPGRY